MLRTDDKDRFVLNIPSSSRDPHCRSLAFATHVDASLADTPDTQRLAFS